MKTAIFTWLFLLPIQIYASNATSTLLTERESMIQQLKAESNESSVVFGLEIPAENETYKAITLSQEQDIQKLKSALAQKTEQIKSQEFTSWKYESAILIFSLGMAVFAFLYIRTKVNFSLPDSLILSPLISQEK